MQRRVIGLDISKVLQVAESLENIVCRCFGPDGGQVLFIKSTGDLLITKDGRKILESLLLDHPVARMIVNCASNHYSVTGDGVKSFIVLLCGILRGLQAAVDKNEGRLSSGNTPGKNRYQSPALKRMSNLLMTFQAEVLEHIIGKHLAPHFFSVFSASKEETKLCKGLIQSTLDAYFRGRIGQNNQMFISKLAGDFFYKCLPTDDRMLEVVSLVRNCFSELHTEVSGLPVDNSRILPGLVLHRQFSVYSPAEGELRALIVTEQIHQCLSESDIDFVICSDAQLQHSQKYLRQRTETIMKHFQNNQVKLILSSVKQKEIVLYYAKQSGISIVDSLPAEEISLVCRITGVSPLSIPLCDVFLGHLTDIFLVTCCQPVLMGSRKYVHLGLKGTSAFQPHCVVVCGPVKGLTEQLVSAFHGAFKMLQQLFQPLDASWGQTTEHQVYFTQNRSVSIQEQSVTCNMRQSKDSACCKSSLPRNYPTVDMHSTDKGENIKLSERVPGVCTAHLKKSSDKCMGACDMWLSQEDETLQQIPVASSVKEENKSVATISKDPCTSKLMVANSKLNSPCNTVAQMYATSFVNAGLVLPGGGTFEILLHYYLSCFAKNCQEAELSMICTIIGDALLCIPRHFYRAETGNARFTLVYTQLISAFQTKELTETAQKGLESVSCKYQLVSSVLHCVSKLVTIDFIVGIKREPQSINSEESDDEL
ncbi:hypothetical protein FKM82_012641 [Ascaphus truei]